MHPSPQDQRLRLAPHDGAACLGLEISLQSREVGLELVTTHPGTWYLSPQLYHMPSPPRQPDLTLQRVQEERRGEGGHD